MGDKTDSNNFSNGCKPQAVLDQKRGMIPTVLADAYLEDIANFKTRDDDIFVVSYPKSGTNMLLYIIDLLSQLEKYGKITKKTVPAPYLEFPENFDVSKAATTPGQYVRANTIPSPRVMMSHLHLHLLPRELREKRGRLIYVARNPKDVAVSFHHFASLTTNLPDYPWPEYLAKYMEGQTHRGLWFDHVLPFWQFAQGNEDRILFVKFEDMILDPASSVRNTANFLGYKLSEGDIAYVVNQTLFENMKVAYTPLDPGPGKKHIKKAPSFMRCGKVGDWRNHFTISQNKIFNALYEEKMKNTGLTFDFGEEKFSKV